MDRPTAVQRLPRPLSHAADGRNLRQKLRSHLTRAQNPAFPSLSANLKPPFTLSVNAASLALALTLLYSPLPCSAIPFPNTGTPSTLSTTPYSQSQNPQFGLQDGKIRPCPATNPGCISTSPKSSSFGFPWVIPPYDLENPIQKLEDAILRTRGNPKIRARENTPDGKYLEAEVDGGFGRDVLEFLIKDDIVGYRCMATKVTYIYPFTTAFGDSKGQEDRLKKINNQLGCMYVVSPSGGHQCLRLIIHYREGN